MNRPRTLSCDEVRDLAPAFVLDVLEPEEAAAVRAHLAGCEDPHPDLATLASSLPALWETIEEVDGPAGLKARVMAAAVAARAPSIGDPSGQTAANPVAVARPAAARPAASRPALARLATAPKAWWSPVWALRIAAVLVLTVLAGWNLSLQGQLGSLRAENDALARVVEVGSRPHALTAVLSPSAAEGPVGLAALTADGHLYVALHNLAPTSGGQVYQAWVILPNATPTPAGAFRVGDSRVGTLADTPAPSAAGAVVAITLEAGPGAVTPTLPILASGTTSGSASGG